MTYLRLVWRCMKIWILKDFAYKGDFFIKVFSVAFTDLIMPLMTFFIYNLTRGIPGWSLDELLLFQGTLIFVLGLARVFSYHFSWWTLDAINWGNFDQYLLKPYSTLLYLLALTVDHYGLAEVATGLVFIIYSAVKLNIGFFSFDALMYVLFIIAGFVVILSSQIIIASMGFIAVKTEALMQLHNKLTDLARYPLNVYDFGIKFFLIFLFPMAVSSFVPAEVLLRGFAPKMLLYLIPVAIYFSLSLWLWNSAMKKYSSAGG